MTYNTLLWWGDSDGPDWWKILFGIDHTDCCRGSGVLLSADGMGRWNIRGLGRRASWADDLHHRNREIYLKMIEALQIIFLYGAVLLALIFFIASTAWFSMEHQRKRDDEL